MFGRSTYVSLLGLVSLFFLFFAQEVLADQIVLINGTTLLWVLIQVMKDFWGGNPPSVGNGCPTETLGHDLVRA